MAGLNADTATIVILVDLAVVVSLGSLLARLARRWGQPPVVGEIVAGIMLGPSLLGLLPGHLTTRLFPLDERPVLTVFANVGLVLFMFGVGFEADLRHMRGAQSAVVSVMIGSVLVPLAAGIGIAFFLYPGGRPAGSHVGELAFVVFVGVAMSITAFPVLARILADLELHRSRLGGFVLTCAAGGDAAAWGLLAIVLAIAGGGGWTRVGWRVGSMLLLVVLLMFAVRPLLRVALRSNVARQSDGLPLVIVLVGLLLSAWATAALGFHPIFGAFMFGAVVPRDALREVAPETPLSIEQTGRLLVPVFFVTTGLTVDLGGIGARGLLNALLVLTVACLGKFIGAAGAARLTGMDRRRSATVGVLMNSRGLTELIVIQAGVTAGVLGQRLATVMIIMAMVTTVVTLPLFRRAYNDRLRSEDAPVSPAVPDHSAAVSL